MKPIRGEFPEFPAPPKDFPAPPGKIPAAARKIPCSAEQGICCKSPEMQRQLIPKPPTLHRIRKKFLLNSLPTGNSNMKTDHGGADRLI